MINLHHTPEWAELTRLILRLDLISHGTTQSFDPTPRDTTRHPGGARPAGGPTDDGNRKNNGHEVPDQVMLRSAEHFRRRARGCRTVADVLIVIDDAKACEDSWKKPPKLSEQPPWVDASQWKRWAARNAGLGVPELARLSGVTRRAVMKRMAGYEGFETSKRREAA